MRNLFILFFLFMIFSCKKNNDGQNTSFSLSETNWKLYYKQNTTFNFYALSKLYFKQNNTVDNYRNFDTISGTWTLNTKEVYFNLDNGDKFKGTAITNDSISGTLIASGNNGVWYAIRN